MLRSALSSPSLVAAALVLSTRQAQCLSAEAGGGVHFAGLRIAPSQLVCESEHCVAIAAPQPIVPGHVLVAPRRAVARPTLRSRGRGLWATAREAQRAIAAGRFAPGAARRPRARRARSTSRSRTARARAGRRARARVVRARPATSRARPGVRPDRPLVAVRGRRRRRRRSRACPTSCGARARPTRCRRGRRVRGGGGGPELAGACRRRACGSARSSSRRAGLRRLAGGALATVNPAAAPGPRARHPRALRARTEELTDEELGTLATARAVQLGPALRRRGRRDVLGVQDGRDAGQSGIPHVHVRIIPQVICRRSGRLRGPLVATAG